MLYIVCCGYLGILDGVSNITITHDSGDGPLILGWNPPFTLNISQNRFDISYLVHVYCCMTRVYSTNTTSTTINIQPTVLNLTYKFVNVTIIPYNAAGPGESRIFLNNYVEGAYYQPLVIIYISLQCYF